MKHCTLYLADIKDKDALHGRLRGALMLPDYYGNNLDALYDCLTDPVEETEIVIRGYDEMQAALGPYAVSFRDAVERAAAENDRLSVSFI